MQSFHNTQASTNHELPTGTDDSRRGDGEGGHRPSVGEQGMVVSVFPFPKAAHEDQYC